MASICFHSISLLIFNFFKFYFILKLYIIVLVLPNIKMNPPQVYMCSLSTKPKYPCKRHTKKDIHKGEGHVKKKVNLEFEATNQWTYRATWNWKRQEKTSILLLQVGVQPPDCERVNFYCLINQLPSFHDDLLWQPWETNKIA